MRALLNNGYYFGHWHLFSLLDIIYAIRQRLKLYSYSQSKTSLFKNNNKFFKTINFLFEIREDYIHSRMFERFGSRLLTSQIDCVLMFY